MPELVVGGVGEPLQVVPTPDMAGDGQRPTTRLLAHLLGDLLAGLDAAAGDDDVGAVTREGEHHLATQAAAATRDQGDLA